MRINLVRIAVIVGTYLSAMSAMGASPDSLSTFFERVSQLPAEQGIEMLRSKRTVLSQQSGQEKWIAESHLLEGERHYSLGQRDSAIFDLRAALAYYEVDEQGKFAARTALGLGNSYLSSGQLNTADTILNQALRYAKADAEIDPQTVVYIYNNLAFLYFYRGEYGKGLDHTQAGIGYAMDKPEVSPAQLITNLTNAGVLYRQMGDYDRAELYLLQALERSKESGTVDFLPYNNLGAMYLAKRDYASAESALQQALTIIRSQDDRDIEADAFSVYHNLSDIYIRGEKWGELKPVLDELLSLHTQDRTHIERTWFHLARYHQAKNHLDQAITYIKLSIAHVQQQAVPNRPFLSELYHLLAEVHLESDPESSLHACQQAIQSLSRDSLPEGRIPVQESLAPRRLLRILLTQGKVYESLSHNHPDSLQYLQETLRTWTAMDSLMDRFLAFYPMEGAQYQLLKGAQPAYQSAIRVAYRLYAAGIEPNKHIELGYYFSEKSKSVLLQARLREHTALQLGAIPDSLREQDHELRHQMSFYQDKIFQEKQKPQPSSAKIALWNEYLFDFQRQADALGDSLKKNYPRYYEFRFQTKPATLSDLQAKLTQTQSHMVVYSMGEDALFLWALDKEGSQHGIEFISVAIDDKWKADLIAFLQRLRDYERILEHGRTKSFWQAFVSDANHWYKQLLPHLVENSAKDASEIGEDLIIVPDGLLGYLPFELLLVNTSDDQDKIGRYDGLDYLLKNWNVRYAYAASLLIQSNVRRENAGELLAVAPEYSGEVNELTEEEQTRGDASDLSNQWWPPLIFNEQEVKDITKIAHGMSLIKEQAEEIEFRRLAPDYQVLHLAMHAFADDVDPMYSGMVFSHASAGISHRTAQNQSENDGILYAHELYHLPLSAELVVLSACNTGTGRLAEGEGILSLARAFTYAGVPNIIMSLWQADDRATAEIMASFYRNLSAGKTKSVALREAKLSYMKQNKKTHPFFWATFVLYGDEQGVEIRHRHSWLWRLIALGGLAILGGFFYYRRKKQK